MATESWAIFYPSGEVIADTTFKDENHAWQIALGWPNAEEIEQAKRNGFRAARVHLVPIAQPGERQRDCQDCDTTTTTQKQ
jgi:hypothetical protein